MRARFDRVKAVAKRSEADGVQGGQLEVGKHVDAAAGDSVGRIHHTRREGICNLHHVFDHPLEVFKVKGSRHQMPMRLPLVVHQHHQRLLSKEGSQVLVKQGDGLAKVAGEQHLSNMICLQHTYTWFAKKSKGGNPVRVCVIHADFLQTADNFLELCGAPEDGLVDTGLEGQASKRRSWDPTQPPQQKSQCGRGQSVESVVEAKGVDEQRCCSCR
mmetsp:Transcript_37441/g.99523  ORF Transcript_37441/g.99523 Transcript_37441/m.99523 type:complete len:215 (+) Transcript_37441:1214-1858(+)